MKFRTLGASALIAVIACVCLFSLAVPTNTVHAQAQPQPTDPTQGSLNLVPCGQVWKNGKWVEEECTFKHLNILFQNIVTAFFFFLVLTLGFLIIRAGFIYLNSGGDTEKLKKAKSGFRHLGIGLLIMLGAWAFYEFAVKRIIDPDVIDNPLVHLEVPDHSSQG